MKVIEITSREFREKQKTYLDKADQGEQVIIKRKGQYYTLVPIKKEEIRLEISPLTDKKISLLQYGYKQGKSK